MSHNQVLVSIVVDDGLVLKHQAISIHNTDSVFVVTCQFHKKWLFFMNMAILPH